MSTFARTTNNEYTCPLCRQISNCVLPVIIMTSRSSLKLTHLAKKHQVHSTSSYSKLVDEPSNSSAKAATSTSNYYRPSLINDLNYFSTSSPAKLMILSSMVDRQTSMESSSMFENLNLNCVDPIYQKITNILRMRPYSFVEIVIDL
jgi:hypothetical protein